MEELEERTVNASKDSEDPSNTFGAEDLANDVARKVDKDETLFESRIHDTRDHEQDALVAKKHEKGQDGLHNSLATGHRVKIATRWPEWKL